MKEYAFILVNKRNNERQELFRWSKQEYTDIITRHIDVNKNVSLMSLNYIIYALNNYNIFYNDKVLATYVSKLESVKDLFSLTSEEKNYFLRFVEV